MPNIMGPDGRIVAFPDGISDADIASVFKGMNLPTASTPGGSFSSQISAGGPLSSDLEDRRNESGIHKIMTTTLGRAGDIWEEMKREARGQ